MSETAEDLRRKLTQTTAELDRLRLTLEVVGTMDLDAGILNRNGVLEAIERGRKWMERRSDIYGLVVTELSGLALSDPLTEDDIELLRHLAATFAAGVREVDEVGRVAPTTFAAVLQDVRPDSVRVVVGRLQALLSRLVGNDDRAGDTFRIGAVEVHSPTVASPAVLETATELASRAETDEPLIRRIENPGS